jgi:hypothetical protein
LKQRCAFAVEINAAASAGTFSSTLNLSIRSQRSANARSARGRVLPRIQCGPNAVDRQRWIAAEEFFRRCAACNVVHDNSNHDPRSGNARLTLANEWINENGLANSLCSPSILCGCPARMYVGRQLCSAPWPSGLLRWERK